MTKTVLITGVNRGLGLEFARQYRADGWRVIGTVRSRQTAADAAAKLGVELHELDLNEFPAIAALGRALQQETIDVVIANAGYMGDRDMPIDNVDLASWETSFRVNTIAPIALIGALLAPLRRSADRKAVAISSRRGSIACNDTGGRYMYRSSKAALNAAWRSLSVDHPALVAFVLHPGWVRTDMGGPSAEVAVEASVQGMRRVIDAAGPDSRGRFLTWDGKELPW
jgi:NAD(P)-dependent dehydrogenase (short-subunit alcohol dehydrogenase family)